MPTVSVTGRQQGHTEPGPERQIGQSLDIGAASTQGDIRNSDNSLVNCQTPEIEAQRERAARVVGHDRERAPEPLELAPLCGTPHVRTHQLCENLRADCVRPQGLDRQPVPP